MVRTEVKLTKNGNSVYVNLPRPIRTYLGWLTGQIVVLEILEDNSLRVRLRGPQDSQPINIPRMVYDYTGAK